MNAKTLASMLKGTVIIIAKSPQKSLAALVPGDDVYYFDSEVVIAKDNTTINWLTPKQYQEYLPEIDPDLPITLVTHIRGEYRVHASIDVLVSLINAIPKVNMLVVSDTKKGEQVVAYDTIGELNKEIDIKYLSVEEYQTWFKSAIEDKLNINIVVHESVSSGITILEVNV